MHAQTMSLKPGVTSILSLTLFTGMPPAAQAQEPATSQPALNVLEGRVLDHEGHPVEGAEVHAVDAQRGYLNYGGGGKVFTYAPDERVWLIFPKRNGRRSGQSTTGTDGRFAIQSLRSGKFNLLAFHPERGAVFEPAVQQPNKGKPVDVKLTPPTSVRGSITGLITPGTRANGWLSYVREGTDGPYDWENDPFRRIWIRPDFDMGEDGTFDIGLLPMGGKYELWIYQPVAKRNMIATLLRQTVSVEQGKTTRVDVDLTKGEQITGQVIGPDGKPLPDVAVAVAGTAPPRVHVGWGDRGALTDKDGRFSIAGMAAGTYQLQANRWLPRTGFG